LVHGVGFASASNPMYDKQKVQSITGAVGICAWSRPHLATPERS
jgi:hypothetical protein